MHHMVVRPPEEDERRPLFSLRRLAYTYPDATPGLREINVDIFAGDRIGLVGQNGSGKSTLIRHLNGLLLAQAGGCRYQDQPITEATTPALRQKVGILFQDPDDHLFCNTLYEDVAFGPRNQGRSPEEVDQLVRKVADSGITVVLVEHDMKMVMNLSDRILVLDYGKKLAEGDRDAIRRNPEVIAAYLGAHA